MGIREATRSVVAASPLERYVWTEPRFVIVGTGRSGTRYISQVLTAAGIKTGHEQWWNPWGGHAARLKGDASWEATFNLDDYTGHIFHQIRNPLKVVRSIIAVEVAPERIANQFAAYRQRWVPFTGDPIVDALNITATWITKAEEVAETTYRIEDIEPELLCDLMWRAGFDLEPEEAWAAIEQVSRTTNAKSHLKPERMNLGWDDLPDGEAKDRLRVHAAKYGYL